MILAAGMGTRMQNLYGGKPKVLLPFGDFTVLELLITKLKNAGIKKIVINLFYKKHEILHFLDQKNFTGIRILTTIEERLLGSGGGIANAEHFFKDEDILVLNSDVLTDLPIQQFIQHFYLQNALAGMAIFPSNNSKNYSLIHFSKNRIQNILAKNAKNIPLNATGIFTGYQLLTTESRNYLTKEPSSIIKDLYFNALEEKKNISAYIHRGTWFDIGTKQLYLETTRKLKNGLLDLNKFMC